MRLNHFRRLLLLGTVAVFVTAGRGGFVPLAAQDAPANQLGVNFIALGSDGQPLKTLKAEQVTVRFNGKPRQVRSLKLVEVGAAPAGDAPATSAPGAIEGIAPPFATNEAPASSGGGANRIFMLAVDEESLRPGSERAMKEALAKWIDTAPAGDLIGLTTMARGTNSVAPSTDRAPLKDAVARIVSRQPSAPDCRTQDALNELGQAAAMIGGRQSSPVVMLFTGQITASSSSRDCQINTTNFDRVAGDLSMAGAQLFIIMPEIVSDMAGIQNLAGSSNSPTINMASGADAALARVLTETAAYYVASFDIEPAERTDKLMRLELRAEGVTIRAPKEVAGASRTAAAGAASGGKADARTMVRDTKAYRDLPLRVMAVPVRADATKIGAMVVFEPSEPNTKLSAAVVGIASADGKIVVLPLDAAALARPMPLVTTGAALPGKYRIRAAATDDKGRGGAVDIEVDLNLTPAGPMQMSGLLLGTLDGATFSNRLVFKSEPQATVYFQLYGTTTKGIAMKIDLFKPGETKAAVTATPQVGQMPGGFNVFGHLPLGDVPPGDYIVKVTFAIEGETPAIVTRTLRKVQ